jgi:hypothetical protein
MCVKQIIYASIYNFSFGVSLAIVVTPGFDVWAISRE